MFLDSTPDTSGYMIAGYVIAFLVMGIYVLSMYIRDRNLKRDLQTLESLLVESRPKVKKEAKKTKKTGRKKK